MSEYKGYTIAIYGDDVYRSPDANSEIDLADLPGAGDPMTSEAWLKIYVSGLKPAWEMLNEPWQGDGGRRFQRKGRVRSFTIETYYFIFPDDMAAYDKVAEMIDHNSVYIYKGNYDEAADWKVHSDGKALSVTVGIEAEHKFSDGRKTLTLAGYASEPRS